MTLLNIVGILVLSLALSLRASLTLASEPIRIVADEWPPFTGSELTGGGFSVQLATEVLNALGYSATVEFMPWKRIMRIRDRNDYDVITAMWHNAERAKDLNYTESYIDNKVVFVSLSDSPFEYTDLAKLNGKRVGIVSSYAYPKTFLDNPAVQWQAGIDLEQNIKKLMAKRLDMIVGTEAVIRFQAKQLTNEGYQDSKALFYDTNHVIERRALHMGVSRQNKQHQTLVRAMNQMMQTFKQDGRFAHIQKQHDMR